MWEFREFILSRSTSEMNYRKIYSSKPAFYSEFVTPKDIPWHLSMAITLENTGFFSPIYVKIR